MLARIESFIKEYGLLQEGDRVVAGVSGGADSVCLLYVLVSLREKMNLTIRAVHVHHGLRGAEADRDAAFVEKLAAGWNVPCRVVCRDVRAYAAEQGLTEEEAGRILRYRAFAEEAQALAEEGTPLAITVKIAVGHQKEDQAETILHNLFRGSSLRGLSGMSPRSGAVIRPLLCMGREEIRGYLREKNLAFCEDSTNLTPDYTRNRVRRLLAEACQEVNERAVDHILAAGEQMARADAYFEKKSADIWAESGRQEDARCGISASVLAGQPEILAFYLARHMIGLCSGSVKDIAGGHIRDIVGLAQKATGKSVSLPCGLRAVREYDMIWVEGAEAAKRPAEAAGALSFSRFPYEKMQKIPENRYTKWFDYGKIENELSVRTRQPGDYITLKGGGRKSVKSYLIDEKVPRQERDRILLLAEGNHVLWIVGYRISEYYKVTGETKEILQVQAYGGEEHGR